MGKSMLVVESRPKQWRLMPSGLKVCESGPEAVYVSMEVEVFRDRMEDFREAITTFQVNLMVAENSSGVLKYEVLQDTQMVTRFFLLMVYKNEEVCTNQRDRLLALRNKISPALCAGNTKANHWRLIRLTR